MPTNTESLNRELFRLLSKYKPKPLDAEGKATPIPDEADIFKFEFTKDGKEYGTVYVTLDDERVLTVYFGDDVTESPGEKTPGVDYDDTWSGLLHQLSAWRMTKGLRGFKTQNKDRVGDDMARRNHMRNKDKIAEGYYPMGKKASYSDSIPSVKIVIEHSRVIEEGEQRYRNINRIFLENQAGERYLLETKKPGIARVYARHIAEGGKVNDDRWSHIGSLVEEYSKMAGFVRATRNGQFNESAQALVNEGLEHYQSLRESLSRMTGKRGYNAYFESWTPSLMEDNVEENNLNELFVQETLDPRIESVMPILNRIHKKVSESVIDKEMNKLAEWADSLSEAEGESLTSNNPVGIPEGKGDFGKAIENLHGWNEVEPHEPDTRQFDFDDDEDGYDASGTVVQDLKTGKIKVDFNVNNGYYSNDIHSTFDSIGDAMDALRTITTQKRYSGGKSHSRDTLALKTPAGPDDVYKTDRAGKKGTLTKGRMDNMKASTQYTMRGGPKGVLPESELDEAEAEGESLTSNNPVGIPESLDQHSPVTQAITRRILMQHPDLLQKYGPEKIGDAIDSVAEFVGDVEEIGSSDVSGWVKQVVQSLDDHQGVAEEVDLGQYDAVKTPLKGKDTSDWDKNFREKLKQYTKELDQRQKEKAEKAEKTDEGLDANQKRVGQLGPTEKVKNNNIGKLVGANENFIGMAPQAVAEGLDDEQRQRLDTLIDQYSDSVDPEAYYGLDDEYPDSDEVIAQIRQEFGDKIADTVEAGASKMHFPRDNHSFDNDPLKGKMSPRVNKSGTINKQDNDYMKREIKRRMNYTSGGPKGVLPEGQEDLDAIKRLLGK